MVTKKKISDLIPYVRNSKKHPKEQIEKIARQISEVGFLVPIIVDKDMVVIAGHGRLEAAKQLLMEDVPVIVAEHLNEEQAMAFRIADNKVAESEWDLPLLAFELGTLERRDFDLTLAGMNMTEARDIIAQGLKTPGAQIPSSPSESTSQSEEEGSEPKEDQQKAGEFAHKCPNCGFDFD